MIEAGATAAVLLIVASGTAGAQSKDDKRSTLEVVTERPATRAEAFRTAISLHDRVEAKPVEAPTPGSHQFWSSLLEVAACVIAIAIAIIALVVKCPRKWLIWLASGLVVTTVGGLALRSASSVLSDAARNKRLRDAQWQWELDLARASSMQDEQAKTAALDAAQRYRETTSLSGIHAQDGGRR